MADGNPELDDSAAREQKRLEKSFSRLNSRDQVSRNRPTSTQEKRKSATFSVAPVPVQSEHHKEPVVSRVPDFKSGEKQASVTDNATSALKGKLDEAQVTEYLHWTSGILGQEVKSLHEFTDGVLLILLLEKLSGMKMGRYNKNPKLNPQKLDNVNVAIMFMENQLHISIKSFSPNAFVTGNTDSILAVIFSLAKKYRSEKTGGVETTLKEIDRQSSQDFLLQSNQQQHQLQQQEEAKKKQEEEAKKHQQQQEQEAKKQQHQQQQEEAKKKQEEENKKLHQQEQEAKKHQQQQQEESQSKEKIENHQEESNKKSVTLSWSYGANSVSVTGSFVNWTEQIPLSLKDGVFQTELQLHPGKYFYKFIADGNWVFDVNRPHVTDESGNVNNVVQIE